MSLFREVFQLSKNDMLLALWSIHICDHIPIQSARNNLPDLKVNAGQACLNRRILYLKWIVSRIGRGLLIRDFYSGKSEITKLQGRA